MRGALDGPPHAAEIDAALETVRGIGAKAVATGATGDGFRCEEGRLKEQFRRFQRDTAFLAAHDAGHGQRLGVICDHQHISVDRDGLLVKQQQLFFRPS